MQEKLKNIVEKFKQSQTSFESYQAISEFVEVVKAIPEYITQVEKEGEIIYQEKIKLNADKGWNHGLSGKELKEHNKWRDRKSKSLHELDPLFPLRNLYNVHEGIKPENISVCSDWLYRFQSPDEPLSKSEKEEYQIFLDKVFKKVVPFLKVEKKEVGEATAKNTKWEDITIRFLNDYDVEIKNGKKSFKADYEQMGFADKRKDIKQETEAKKSWKLLQAFSMSNNIFPLSTLTIQERDRCKKQKQELSKLLKQYFGIADDPISYDETKKEYRLKIKLIPEKEEEPQTWGRKIFEENSL
jgi:hypothetical protein